MNKKFLDLLICPNTKEILKLSEESIDENGLIISGKLSSSKNTYNIENYIPRFVNEHYANNFSYQWNLFNETQLDKKNAFDISKKRFFETTKWPKQLNNEVILEVGCGMGRFTEHAISTNATVVSFDLSRAVDANYKNNKNSNLFIVQADIYNMPFRDNTFDKVFCFGVLQHTPNVKKSFFSIVSKLKLNGKIAIDVYRKHKFLSLIFNSKTRPETRTRFWIRPFTKNMNEKKLYKIVSLYIKILWPICSILNYLPFGNYLNWLLCIADYRKAKSGIKINKDKYLDWAILDTFDMLSATYDSPQTIDEVKKWFIELNFSSYEVTYGYNGIEGRGNSGS